MQNLLPQDGEVYYHGPVFSQKQADSFYLALIDEVNWKNDEVLMFGKKIITRRKTAWCADQDYSYTYSKIKRTAALWTPVLKIIKGLVEDVSQDTYNSCLLNLYHEGSEGMGWHSDNEPELKKQGTIASVSLGAERKFAFKHKKSAQKVFLDLQHGSLLVMKGPTQSHWQHSLLTSKKVKAARINLTFRTIREL